MKAILGISAFYHDSAAALLIDGQIVAAAQEERFTRIKHDPSYPEHAIDEVLRLAGLSGSDISEVVFYEKPFLKFERLLETYHAFAPQGFSSFAKAMPVWLKDKLYTKSKLKKRLAAQDINAPLFFTEHHLSHAASAFYPSPFEEAAILTVDGVGEWATTTIAHGKGHTITVLKELHFPHSIGLLYSAFTYYCGFRVNSGEYKLMGLAPYSSKQSPRVQQYVRRIKENMVDIREDGSILLQMNYFDFATGLEMTCNKRWTQLFGIPKRAPESEIAQEYIDLALAAQLITEDILLKLAATAKAITGSSNLVMAGGVALNCVANAQLQTSGLFQNIWIQPAAGDAGGALGAALAAWHIRHQQTRKPAENDSMSGAYLGTEFSNKDIARFIRKKEIDAVYYPEEEIYTVIAGLLNEGNIIGLVRGRMEYGPRALGNRSIIADPRNIEMQKKLNRKIKFRESFRPFAPAVLEEDASEYFNLNFPSPYMLMTAQLSEKYRLPLPDGYENLPYMDKLYTLRSRFQAITHVDFSARAQTVSAQTNPPFHALITAFKSLTGCGMVVNTSFNVRGEPIVCSPEDAYNCFLNTDMDCLVLENYVIRKPAKKQPDTINTSK
ncbi:MAG: carbamoyltransferase [Candidatus Symbiothrix sp.]|jgi:carbamoyltransferase|nr:carbamoyltransferase [Candidatus Symbiothrix sp.]